MSNTYRAIPTKSFRSPATQSTRRTEARALDALLEAGFGASNRLVSRVSSLPSDWDDLPVGAWSELDYSNNTAQS